MKKSYIYKYRTVSDNSLNALVHNQLFATTPNRFNDPFDCEFPFSIVTVPEMLAKDVVFLKNLFEYKYSREHIKKPSKQLIEAYIKEIQNDESGTALCLDVAELARAAMISIKDSSLVCCFSKTMNSLSQWAYYCDDSRGFAVEYDPEKINEVIRQKFKIKSEIRDVTYESRRAEKSDLMIDILKEYVDYLHSGSSAPFLFSKELDNLDAIYLTKREEWRYEYEVRFVISRETNGSNAVLIEKIKPHAIYLGYKAESWLVEFMKSYCMNKKIGLYQLIDKNFGFKNKLARKKLINMNGTPVDEERKQLEG